MARAVRPDLSTLTGAERVIGWICLGGIGLLVAFVTITFVFDPPLAVALIAFIALGLIGREAAMALGSTLGISPWVMFAVNAVQSLVLGFLIYLLVIHFFVHRPEGLLGRWGRRLRSQADHNRRPIDRFGPFGIFMLMFIPLIARPYLGAIAGRLAGMRIHHIMIPVAAGTVIVAGIWAFSVSVLIDHLGGAGSGFGLAITAFLVLLTLIAPVLFYKRRRNLRRSSTTGSPT